MPTHIVRREHCADDHLHTIAHPVLRQIYASRNVADPTQLETSAKSLLHYQSLGSVDKAVKLLADAIAHEKQICVVGDFDADGATSTALCMLALTRLGSRNHRYLVPNRFDFGYGLSPQIVEIAHQEGAELIMTVDNGISCFDGVDCAKALGMQVLVTDHHLAAERLPAADAIVNPNAPGCGFSSKHLAGVGVAFYLMLALRAHLREKNWFEDKGIEEPNLAELLDVVALGTVADVVQLDQNNRVLVHQGLQRIRSGKCRPGILAMIEVAGRDHKRMVASDLGFVLGPRLNAAGRLDDMAMGIECLLTEQVGQARQIAVQLDSLNRERREIESSMQQEAERTLEALQFSESELPYGVVLYQPDFHQGVIGILAGRIKDKYFRPTIAFAHQDDDTLKGSARSIPGLHIRDLLEEINGRYPGLIGKFGGHAMAAGLSIASQDVEAFKQAFDSTAQHWLQGRALQGEVVSDGELTAGDLSLEFAALLRDAGPWGQGFEEPIFDGVFDLLSQRIVGDKHLKMQVRIGTLMLDAIAFNVDTQIWPNPQCKQMRLAYKLDINEFRGRVSLQLLVDALQVA